MPTQLLEMAYEYDMRVARTVLQAGDIRILETHITMRLRMWHASSSCWGDILRHENIVGFSIVMEVQEIEIDLQYI